MVNKNEKVLILSNVAKVLTEGGEPEKRKRLLQGALSSARFSEQQTVLERLPIGASTIEAIDQGQIPWQVYQALLEVERWWSNK
jgi:hypothetical protein